MKKIAEAFHSAKNHTLLNEVPLRTENENLYKQPCEHGVNTTLTLRVSFQFYDSNIQKTRIRLAE